jgi:crossover junction endodeoxyribonuclease RuvC
MKVLAIDPGLKSTGYAILEEKSKSIQLIFANAIVSDVSMDTADKIHNIYFTLFEIVSNEYVTDIAFETAFMHKNEATFMKLSCIRGVLYLLAKIHGLKIHEFAPQVVKKIVTGHGHSDKEGVARFVLKLFPGFTAPERNDVTDAIAIGISAFWSKK